MIFIRFVNAVFEKVEEGLCSLFEIEDTGELICLGYFLPVVKLMNEVKYLTHLSMYFKTGETNDKDVQVVELPIVDSLHPRPPYLPLAVPEDLADRLIRVHGDPAVWWVSQFVKYLIRPQPWLEKEIEEATRKLGFKHPVIGWVFSFLFNSLSFNMCM